MECFDCAPNFKTVRGREKLGKFRNGGGQPAADDFQGIVLGAQDENAGGKAEAKVMAAAEFAGRSVPGGVIENCRSRMSGIELEANHGVAKRESLVTRGRGGESDQAEQDGEDDRGPNNDWPRKTAPTLRWS